ncbi:vitamin K epoxide reductase family protein [Candidatus Wolfebacteria bacterium]|nr:vitamin K epoxide reductase family protein [Candidatus Wolfebacteria bacterium]
MENKNLKIYVWIFWVLSFVGFLNALYLFVKKIFGSPITCYIFKGCEAVTNSPYSLIFGIPLSFFGVLFYLAIFLVSVRYFQTQNVKLFKIIFYFACLGLLFALYYLFLQIFVIKALCVYCLVSAAVSVGLFITGLISLKNFK